MWCEALSFGEAFARKSCFNKIWLPGIAIRWFGISIIHLQVIGENKSTLFLTANRLVALSLLVVDGFL